MPQAVNTDLQKTALSDKEQLLFKFFYSLTDSQVKGLFCRCRLQFYDVHRRSCLLVTSRQLLRCIIPQLYTQSSAPEDGRNYRPKHVTLIEIVNKLLLLHLVGCLYYCINDARSHKHQNYVHSISRMYGTCRCGLYLTSQWCIFLMFIGPCIILVVE